MVSMVLNRYSCPACGHEWEDRWSCACNDQCVVCRRKDVEPTASEDLNESEGQDG